MALSYEDIKGQLGVTVITSIVTLIPYSAWAWFCATDNYLKVLLILIQNYHFLLCISVSQDNLRMPVTSLFLSRLHYHSMT